jgi:hypothetical protein
MHMVCASHITQSSILNPQSSFLISHPSILISHSSFLIFNYLLTPWSISTLSGGSNRASGSDNIFSSMRMERA